MRIFVEKHGSCTHLRSAGKQPIKITLLDRSGDGSLPFAA